MAADERPGVWRRGQGIQGRNRRHHRGCHNGGAEIRQSWARGSVMTQRRGEMHRRGCSGDANPMSTSQDTDLKDAVEFGCHGAFSSDPAGARPAPLEGEAGRIATADKVCIPAGRGGF
jgi:hypothetical protein